MLLMSARMREVTLPMLAIVMIMKNGYSPTGGLVVSVSLKLTTVGVARQERTE